jgi:dTDP-4-amino-4,6-dideoxygalactose transaminase
LDIAGWYLTPIHPVAELDYDKIGYKTGLCINSEQMINRVVHLPTGKGLTQDSLIAIIDILKNHRPATN